jgi:hypothetical protein
VYPRLEFAAAHWAEKGLSEAGQLEYENIGHSVFSDDGGHFYAGGGFKVVIGR